MSGKTLNQPSFTCWTTYVSTTLSRNYVLGSSFLSAYSLLSIALDLAQMVLDVRKNLKPTQFYLLNNLCYNNFAQKSSPGGVLALGLLLAVYGPGLGPDGPGCLENPKTNPVYHSWQLLFQQLSQKINPWKCLGSGPSGTCWRAPRWPGPEIWIAHTIFGPWGSRLIHWYPTLDATTKP